MNSVRERRPLLPAIRVPLFAVCAAFAAAAALRYLWIEPEVYGHQCTETVAPWWCPMRLALIDLLWRNGLGVVAMVLLAAAVVVGRRGLAIAAMATAAAGLLLYGHEWSAVAMLGGLILLARDHQRGAREGEEAPQ